MPVSSADFGGVIGPSPSLGRVNIKNPFMDQGVMTSGNMNIHLCGGEPPDEGWSAIGEKRTKKDKKTIDASRAVVVNIRMFAEDASGLGRAQVSWKGHL